MRLTPALLTSRAVGSLVLRPIAFRGYRHYRDTDQTPRRAYAAMRKLFAADPNSFDRLVAEAQTEHAPLEGLDASRGLVGGRIDEVARQLHVDGIAVLPTLLSEAECVALEDVARKSTCVLIDSVDGAPPRAQFDPETPLAVRYNLEERDILGCDAAQRLLADESLLALAQAYLGAAPVQDMVAMWWSTTAGQARASSKAAQLFHFDLDRLRFLKAFVYVTNVDNESGPHEFVRGSHRMTQRHFRDDRRYSDAEVRGEFDRDMVTIDGPRGTVFLADTRGLHKGHPLQRGHRLVFQLEYAISLFGQTVDRVMLPHRIPELAGVMRRYPYTFRRLETVHERDE